MFTRDELMIIYGAAVNILVPYLHRKRRRQRRLEEQAEDEIQKARKNAKIEQCLKIVDSRGEVNKRTMIEQWLTDVEAERRSMVQIQESARTTPTLSKVTKTPVRRSARLKLKQQSNDSTLE